MEGDCREVIKPISSYHIMTGLDCACGELECYVYAKVTWKVK